MFIRLRRTVAVAATTGSLVLTGVAISGQALAAQGAVAPSAASTGSVLTLTGPASLSAGTTFDVTIAMHTTLTNSLWTDIVYRIGDHTYTTRPAWLTLVSVTPSSSTADCEVLTAAQGGDGVQANCQQNVAPASADETVVERYRLAADAPEHALVEVTADFNRDGIKESTSGGYIGYIDGPPAPIKGTVSIHDVSVRAGSNATVPLSVDTGQNSVVFLSFTTGSPAKVGYPHGVTLTAPAGCQAARPADDGYTCAIATGQRTLDFTVTAAQDASTTNPAAMTAVLTPADNTDDMVAHAEATLTVLPASASGGSAPTTPTGAGPTGSTPTGAAPTGSAPTAPAGSGATLARTGASGSIGAGVTALGLLVLGAGALLVARRRSAGSVR